MTTPTRSHIWDRVALYDRAEVGDYDRAQILEVLGAVHTADGEAVVASVHYRGSAQVHAPGGHLVAAAVAHRKLGEER